MVQVNFARRQVNCKIVYYGPGLSGKTTNLEVIHDKIPSDRKGTLTSIKTEGIGGRPDGDRTLFFDFLPLDLGKVGGMTTRFHLFTVPGQVYYNSTRKLVLSGADGVVFVADSAPDKIQENADSLNNLIENLRDHNLSIRDVPIVLQWNKRDLPNALPVSVLEEKLNLYGCPSFEAVAIRGTGVFPTLKKAAEMVLDTLNKRMLTPRQSPQERAPAPAPALAPVPVQIATEPEPPELEAEPVEPEAEPVLEDAEAEPIPLEDAPAPEEPEEAEGTAEETEVLSEEDIEEAPTRVLPQIKRGKGRVARPAATEPATGRGRLYLFIGIGVGVAAVLSALAWFFLAR